ncbi:peptidoglycan-binding protein [Leptolyngbya subtilissima AS-A7]
MKVDGVFGLKSERAVKSFQSRSSLKADGVVGPKTWAVLSKVGSSPSLGTPSTKKTGKAIAAIAYKVVTGGYRGGKKPTYKFGAENTLYWPDLVSRTDCSELVQICVSSLLKNSWVDGSRFQYAATRKISVQQAMKTPGALLFVSSNGKPSGIHHVAISLGDGRTAEARSTRSGVGVFKTGILFNFAGLVPGLKY